jgi:hypothetical protein
MVVVSQRMAQVMDRLGPVAHFFSASAYGRRAGNPHELPLRICGSAAESNTWRIES